MNYGSLNSSYRINNPQLCKPIFKLFTRSGYKIGDILYQTNIKKKYFGITRKEIENNWICHLDGSDTYLPCFCKLLNKLKSILAKSYFGTFSEMAFPRILPITVAKRYGLLDAWPYILCSVIPYKEDGQDRVIDNCQKHVLDPVQCIQFYAWMKDKIINHKELPLCIYESLGGWSYRNELKGEIRPIIKAKEFIRNEYVFIGTPDDVKRIRIKLINEFCKILNKYEISYRMVVGFGCFETEKSILIKKLKNISSSIDIPIIDIEIFLPEDGCWIEVFGATLWNDRLLNAFNIRSKNGSKIESGCIGIGISRFAYLVLSQLGKKVHDFI